MVITYPVPVHRRFFIQFLYQESNISYIVFVSNIILYPQLNIFWISGVNFGTGWSYWTSWKDQKSSNTTFSTAPNYDIQSWQVKCCTFASIVEFDSIFFNLYIFLTIRPTSSIVPVASSRNDSKQMRVDMI